MQASRQDWGHTPSLHDWLKQARMNSRPASPRLRRKRGAISSGPSAPFFFPALSAACNSVYENSAHSSPTPSAISDFWDLDSFTLTDCSSFLSSLEDL